jgi:hypothetical protein
MKWDIAARGFIHSKHHYIQALRDANELNRAAFCEWLISEDDIVDDVIFSEECSEQLNQNTRISVKLMDAPWIAFYQ